MNSQLITKKKSKGSTPNQIPSQPLPSSEDDMNSIHSYFAMLKHIFQRNKNLIRQKKEASDNLKKDNSLKIKK